MAAAQIPGKDRTVPGEDRTIPGEDAGATAPVACSLTRAGLAAQARRWERLAAGAMIRSELTGQAAFDLSRLDETFQEERWGVDAEAEARAEAMAQEALTLERWFAAL